MDEAVDEEDGGDGAGGVHALFLIPTGALFRGEVLGGEVAGRDDLHTRLVSAAHMRGEVDIPQWTAAARCAGP